MKQINLITVQLLQSKVKRIIYSTFIINHKKREWNSQLLSLEVNKKIIR